MIKPNTLIMSDIIWMKSPNFSLKRPINWIVDSPSLYQILILKSMKEFFRLKGDLDRKYPSDEYGEQYNPLAVR